MFGENKRTMDKEKDSGNSIKNLGGGFLMEEHEECSRTRVQIFLADIPEKIFTDFKKIEPQQQHNHSVI